MAKQGFNPYLPLNEYIPDGEPHVFGDRVYIFGSHDKEGGETFCMLDYTVYSASVTDLTNWRKEGVIYKASQDPDYANRKYMYAPDVVQGNDGRFYLYYSMSGDFGQGGYHGPISVAVCDTPAGEYEYLGYVKHPDGSPMLDYVCFDPAAINDEGQIYIYYGTWYDFELKEDFLNNEDLIQTEMEMFGKSREEIVTMAQKDSILGPCIVELEDDMLTVKTAAKHIIPYDVRSTSFEAHPFFEGSSIRKIGNTYYFVYSSMKNHELCYATSKYPDRDFVFGGTIVSNGDVGAPLPHDCGPGLPVGAPRPDDMRLNMTGTTHGSIEQINGKWYVFYHRQTHKSDYSRQALAEAIEILPDGSIPQVETTSCGLNGGPLLGQGIYPAPICCNLTNGHMPHGSNSSFEEHFPHITHQGEDRYVSELGDKCMVGYKYFSFEDKGSAKFSLTYRGDATGTLYICTDFMETETEISHSPANTLGTISISSHKKWTREETSLSGLTGTLPLYFIYEGEGEIDILEFELD